MADLFYIHPDNPQNRLLQQVVTILNNHGVIAFPTDSGYALGCLIDNKAGVDRISTIRQLDKNHHLTLMCKNLSELALYSYVDNTIFRLLKKYTPGRYVFILEANKEVPKRIINEKRKTIGLRVPDHTLDLALLNLLDKPLLTASLILPSQTEAMTDPDEIDQLIGHQLDGIIHGGYLSEQATSVIDLTSDFPEVIRQGSGDISPFTS